MKKLTFLIFFIVLFATQAHSQFLSENFDYPAGDSLGAHGWTSFSGGATNRLLVTAPGLTFPYYAGTGIGNATTVASTGQDAYIPLPVAVDTGLVYLSFMTSVDTAKTGDYFTAFLSSTSTSNYTGRVYVKLAANGNLAFGLSKTTAGAGGIFYSDSVYSTGVTYLLVLKYDFNAGTNNDSVSLFVFDNIAPVTEPAPTVGPIGGTGSDLPDIGRVPIRQGSASSSPYLRLDGGYLSNSFNDNVLPVELASFSSVINRTDVTLNWSTSSELNNSGFDIERSSANSLWSKVGYVAGNGTTSEQKNYSFTDRNLNTGNYSYRLKQIDFNGNYNYFNLNSEVKIGIPEKYALSQNYPNPFNPSTKISFDLPYESKVSVRLFDLSGKEVATLVNEVKTAGYYTVNFNGANLSSGVYFYTISAQSSGNNFTETKRMMLIK